MFIIKTIRGYDPKMIKGYHCSFFRLQQNVWTSRMFGPAGILHRYSGPAYIAETHISYYKNNVLDKRVYK